MAPDRPPVDLLIVGAPRSGTTSLFAWLAAHPDLRGSDPKETFYFMDPMHPLAGRHGASYHEAGMAGYEQFFRTAPVEARRFEGTTHHYYQETARQALSALDPRPLVVFLLRNPAERIRSSFRYTMENLGAIDRSLSFDTYVRWLLAGEIERAEPYYRSASSFWIAARQLELSRYVHWIDLWKRDLGDDRVELFLLRDLTSRPRPILDRICDRLDIDPTIYRDLDLPAHNPSRGRVRWQAVQRLARRASRFVPGIWKDRLLGLYYAVQETERPRSSAESESWGVRRLEEHFEPWNRALCERHGLNIDSWLPDDGR